MTSVVRFGSGCLEHDESGFVFYSLLIFHLCLKNTYERCVSKAEIQKLCLKYEFVRQPGFPSILFFLDGGDMSQHKKSCLHHFLLCFFLFCHTQLLPAGPAHTSTSDGGSASPGHSVRKLKSNIINVLSQLSQRTSEPSQFPLTGDQETSPRLGNISITWSFPSSLFSCSLHLLICRKAVLGV